MTTPHTLDWETLTKHPMTSSQNAVIALITDLYDVLDPVPPRLVENVIANITRHPTRSN